MCDTCGCNQNEKSFSISFPDEEKSHSHNGYTHSHDGYEHTHNHNDQTHVHEHNDRVPEQQRFIKIEEDILGKNNLLAERNRGYFEARNIIALNLMSSPGSGKTSILEKTISKLKGIRVTAVIEGDQQTMNDAMRIKAAGALAVQVNTGFGCHLDAEMINQAVRKLSPAGNSLLFIENVGNLVCPSLFRLGESRRVVIISVTEGDDKPAKYPTIFETCNMCLINKTDLLPYVDFNMEKVKKAAKEINPHIEFISLSARTGEGLNEWCSWLLALAD